MTEHFPDLMKLSVHIQQLSELPSRINSNQTVKRQLFDSSYIRGMIDKINNWFLISNHAGQRERNNIFKVLREKKKEKTFAQLSN